jgi:hypothetical protein
MAYGGLAVLAVIGVGIVYLPRRLVGGRRGSDTGRLPSLFTGDSPPDETAKLEAIPRAHAGIETYFEKGKWKNKVQGSSRAANTHATKAEAQRKGRDMAFTRKVEHTIKNKDGTVGERKSYGNDPRRIPGQETHA